MNIYVQSCTKQLLTTVSVNCFFLSFGLQVKTIQQQLRQTVTKKKELTISGAMNSGVGFQLVGGL